MLAERADPGAAVQIPRQQRDLRVALLEPLQDRHRLREAHGVAVLRDLEHRHLSHRVARLVRRVELLLREEVHGDVLVRQVLQREADADAPGRRGSPVGVEPHHVATTRWLIVPNTSRPRGVARGDLDPVAGLEEARPGGAVLDHLERRAARRCRTSRGRDRRSRPCRCRGSSPP